jgi:ribosomal protein S18 acetylase RimI-like enzyme
MTLETRFRVSTASLETQRERIQALVARFPECNIHVLDATYRLTSPTRTDSSCVRVWEDGAGHLVAFALWQSAFKMLDYGFDPNAQVRRIAADILDWAVAWFAQPARIGDSPSTCWVKVLEQNTDWREAVESRGFVRCTWSIAHMARSLDREVEPAVVPDGFQIRAVEGEAEAEAWAHLHRAVFPRVGMTADWRLRMVRAPNYRADLDLVVVAPEGELVAFCQGWVGKIAVGVEGEIEPFGTHPAFRRRGLGRAVLVELMNRLRSQGVRAIFGEPWDDNRSALESYRALRFRPTFTIPTFARTFPRG